FAVFATASAVHHIPVATYANKGDGASYIAYAKAMCGDASSLTEYDRRVFPGYPALIALLHLTGLPVPWAALLLDWLGAGVAVVAAGFALLHFWTGDAMQGVRIYRDSPQAYVGSIFAWPFESLVMTPIREVVPWPQIPWIWLHVAVVLMAVGILARRVISRG